MRYIRPMRPAPDEILLEITRLGSVQRVSAIDPLTLVEVVFQAPLSADSRSIELLARQKLAYRLARGQVQAPAPRRGGGTIV